MTENWQTCLDCNIYDDMSKDDTFMRPFGDDDFICELCAEKRGAVEDSDHSSKSLAITYRRNGYTFTAYGRGTGAETLEELKNHPHFPGEDNVGADSWEWLRRYLGEVARIDSMPCTYTVDHGDWTVTVICDV